MSSRTAQLQADAPARKAGAGGEDGAGRRSLFLGFARDRGASARCSCGRCSTSAVNEFTRCRYRTRTSIRQQAREKHLDPALIAGVIYAETKFPTRPRRPARRG